MWLQSFDRSLFEFIHVSLANDVFDSVLPLFRIPQFWVPLYLFFLVFMWQKKKVIGLWWFLFFLLSFTLADYSSASIIKPWVHRLRPCNDPDLAHIIRQIVLCGTGYSFPSSHACNHFAMATFVWVSIGHINKYIFFLIYSWAILICFTQIYVGVHYPLDILAGAIWGFILGKIVAWLFIKRFGYI